MIERLYPHDPEAAPSSALRIAEEYRTYFGQSGLDDFIRTSFPDRSWTPGQLHTDLLELPWTDILTTNWDTLLERAAEGAVDRSYEVVRTEADLTYAKSPRIVKLHGTIGDAGPLIFAEEDYRTYPTNHAAFVNLARQVFIENELCLVGFSGDDPNFLQWAGWVRDHLSGSARRIYLVGNLRLERATRKYLEAHNIAPIDLAPLVQDLSRKDQHARATRIFIDELVNAKPPLQHEWKLTPSNLFPLPSAGANAYDRVRKDHAFAAEILKKTILLFKADREKYPGWLICPLKYRHTLHYAGDETWLMRKPVLDLLEPKDRAAALFEIIWRRTISFSPIDQQLADNLTELANLNPPELDPEKRLEFVLALLRDARVSHDDEGMKRWGDLIEATATQDSRIRLEAEYQMCLRARDQMNWVSLADRLAKMTSEEPIWKLRRAALHAEIGEYATATRLIRGATAELERRHRLDRNSISIKSQLAWASWLSRAAAMGVMRWDDLPQPRDFTEFDIDPEEEIRYVERKAGEIEKKRRDDAVEVRPAFEAGHYRNGARTIHIGRGDPGTILLYELDQLIEQVGIPTRINQVNICEDAAIASVQVARQAHVDWYVWLLRALHYHGDRPFEIHFSRLAIAQMSPATSSALISIVESAINFWASRFKLTHGSDLKEDFSRAVDALRFSIMVLSRLTVWMQPERATAAIRRATAMANNPQISQSWLIEALGEMEKLALNAIPTEQQGALALVVLQFPLPSEKESNLPSAPQIVTEIWNARPFREPSDMRWDHRVHQLVEALERGQSDRIHATLSLAYLALRNVLKPDEAAAFGKGLWSDLDLPENGLPRNSGLLPGALLQLPTGNEIDVRARLQARLFNVNLTDLMKLPSPMNSADVNAKISHMESITQAVKSGLILPADVAVRMFDEVVIWEPKAVDHEDPFGASFARAFSDSIRLAVGNLLTIAVVPSLTADQCTDERACNLMAFISRTRSWTGLGALPLFLPTAHAVSNDIISTIRRGLIGSESQHVGGAAMAINGWAKLVRDKTLADLPRSLIEQLITTVEVCREVGLSAMLETTRTLLKDGFLLDEDLKRLLDALSMIRSEFRYEKVEFDTMRAVSVSLVRAECVKLATALERFSIKLGHILRL